MKTEIYDDKYYELKQELTEMFAADESEIKDLEAEVIVEKSKLDSLSNKRAISLIITPILFISIFFFLSNPISALILLGCTALSCVTFYKISKKAFILDKIITLMEMSIDGYYRYKSK